MKFKGGQKLRNYIIIATHRGRDEVFTEESFMFCEQREYGNQTTINNSTQKENSQTTISGFINRGRA